MKKIIKHLFLLAVICILIMPSTYSQAKQLTKKEIINKLSKSPLVKKKVNDLFDWTKGYDASKISRASMAPIIKYLRAVPIKVPPDNRTIISIFALIDDPAGLDNIKSVKADLRAIGKRSYITFVDNGMWGDSVSGDGVYTLQTSASSKATVGIKSITVQVTNKKGWETIAEVRLSVNPAPLVMFVKSIPPEIFPGGQVTLQVGVSYPGSIKNIKRAIVNLSAINGNSQTILYNDGTHGDQVKGDTLFTTRFTLPIGASKGEKSLPVEVTDINGLKGWGVIRLKIK